MALLVANANWLADHWIRRSALATDVVVDGLLLIFAAVLLRCPTLLCSALLSGLNRLDILNALRAGTQSLRQLGGIAVLLVRGDLLSLLLWEVIVSALEFGLFYGVSRRLLPGLSLRPRWPAEAIRGCWRYALGMNAIYVIALLLTQTDKLAISRLLSLEALGIYHLAYSLTAWIALIQGGFNSAVLPSLAADSAHARHTQLRTRHNKSTRLTVYAVALPATAIMFFPAELMGTWLDGETTRAAATTVSLLAAGFLLNAAVSNCLTVAVAAGDSGLPLRINLAGLAIYLPALAWLLDRYGLAGAALAWIALNAYYLAALVPVVQRRHLQQTTAAWWGENFLPFILLAGAIFGGARLAADALDGASPWPAAVCVGGAAVVYSIGGFFLLGRELRGQISAAAGGWLRAASSLRP